MGKEYTKIEKLFFLSELAIKYCDEFIKASDENDLDKMSYFNHLTSCITELMLDISKRG